MFLQPCRQVLRQHAMRLLSALLLITAVPSPADAQNPPSNYTPQSTPYTGTEAWYCERITGTVNGRCNVTDLLGSITALPTLITTGTVTTGGASGAGFTLNIGTISYAGTFPNSVFSAAYTIPFPLTSGGTGTATPSGVIAGNGITVSGSFPAQTVTLAGGAMFTGLPGNPANTISGTGVMMGLGSTCTVTPTRTGNILFIISGQEANNTAGDGINIQLRGGTGSAPANAAMPVGNVLSSTIGASMVTGGGAQNLPFTIQGTMTGQALSTALWFDIKLASITGGTVNIANVKCSAVEF